MRIARPIFHEVFSKNSYTLWPLLRLVADESCRPVQKLASSQANEFASNAIDSPARHSYPGRLRSSFSFYWLKLQGRVADQLRSKQLAVVSPARGPHCVVETSKSDLRCQGPFRDSFFCLPSPFVFPRRRHPRGMHFFYGAAGAVRTTAFTAACLLRGAWYVYV